jgi:ATP-dependent protease ClpP protease subunit
MKITVNINGIIGLIPDGNDGYYTPNVTFLDIVRQVESHKDVTEIDVVINSEGGFVEEGNDIYDYLISLKSKGIIVNTIAKEVCASIATKVFLAGDKRIINGYTDFMIHNPFGLAPEGDADVIEQYYKELRSIENDLINFYTQITGTSKEAIKPLMKKETYLTADNAVELGFATEKVVKIEVQALAYSNKLNTNINSNQNQNQMAKETLDKNGINLKINELLSAIKNFGKGTKNDPKGLKIVLDANAGEVEFPELESDDTPSVGDKTTASDGDYVMPDGSTYVILEGSLTEIKPAEGEEQTSEDESEEMATLKTKITELEGQLAEVTALKTENDQLKTDATAQAKEIKNLAKGLKDVQRSLGSSFDHTGDKKNLKKEGEPSSRSLMKAEK